MIHLICPNPAVDRTILLKKLLADTPNRPLEVRDFAGGKSFNVAYALLREGGEELNNQVTVHTILGGENGERVSRLAKEQGIKIKALQVDQNTRECNIVVDTSNETIYPIYERGFELTPALLDQFTHQLTNSIEENDVVVFSGSLMKGMPDDYMVRVREALNHPVRFLIDSSGPAMKEAYDAKVAYIIKINDEEYNELFEINLITVADYAQHLKVNVLDNIPYFMITLGENGLLLKYEKEIYHFQAPAIKVKNPVASGDHLFGGLIRGLVTNRDLFESVKKAVAYATSNCLHWYPSIDLDQVSEIIPQLTVKKL